MPSQWGSRRVSVGLVDRRVRTGLVEAFSVELGGALGAGPNADVALLSLVKARLVDGYAVALVEGSQP